MDPKQRYKQQRGPGQPPAKRKEKLCSRGCWGWTPGPKPHCPLELGPLSQTPHAYPLQARGPAETVARKTLGVWLVGVGGHPQPAGYPVLILQNHSLERPYNLQESLCGVQNLVGGEIRAMNGVGDADNVLFWKQPPRLV